MRLKSLIGALSLAVASWFGGASAEAADLGTTIEVQGMHCVSCARKIAGHLQAVPEAGPVAVDVATGKVTVPPRSQAAPSPRALWEAVERAGYKPLQMIGPYGTFKAKPTS